MQHRQRNAFCGLSAMFFLVAGSAIAQDNNVKFVLPGAGGDGGTVPTLNGQAINWDANGDLVVVCTDDDQDGFCDGTVGKSTGSTEGAASVGMLKFSSGGTITNNGANTTIGTTQSLGVTVQWQAATTVDVCQMTTTGSPAPTPNWTSQKVDISGGTTKSQNFTLSASQTADLNYQFSLTCYNLAGSDEVTGTKIITATVEKRTSGGGTGGTGGTVYPGMADDSCDITKGTGAGADPLFQPDGYTKQEFDWTTAMFKGKDQSIYPDTGYPKMPSDQPPVGSFTLGGATMKNKYISIAFEENAHVSRYVLQWIQAFGYSSSPSYIVQPAGNIFVTVSPCAGDFRYTTTQKTAAERAAGDPTFTRACRVVRNEANVTLNNDITQTAHCTTEPGRRYYLNVMIADPRDGFSTDPDTGAPVENTCNVERTGYSGKCEVQFKSY